jgi:hypothetical protein
MARPAWHLPLVLAAAAVLPHIQLLPPVCSAKVISAGSAALTCLFAPALAAQAPGLTYFL